MEEKKTFVIKTFLALLLFYLYDLYNLYLNLLYFYIRYNLYSIQFNKTSKKSQFWKLF